MSQFPPINKDWMFFGQANIKKSSDFHMKITLSLRSLNIYESQEANNNWQVKIKLWQNLPLPYNNWILIFVTAVKRNKFSAGYDTKPDNSIFISESITRNWILFWLFFLLILCFSIDTQMPNRIPNNHGQY